MPILGTVTVLLVINTRHSMASLGRTLLKGDTLCLSSLIVYFSVLYLTEMTHLLTPNIWLALFTRSTEVKEAPPPLQKEATQFSSKWNKCRWRIERERFFIFCRLSLTVCFHLKVYLSRLQQSGKREKAHKVSHSSGETGRCATITVLKINVIWAEAGNNNNSKSGAWHVIGCVGSWKRRLRGYFYTFT